MLLLLDMKGDFYLTDRNPIKKKPFSSLSVLHEGNIGLSTTSLIRGFIPSIPKSEYTVFLYKNLF